VFLRVIASHSHPVLKKLVREVRVSLSHTEVRGQTSVPPWQVEYTPDLLKAEDILPVVVVHVNGRGGLSILLHSLCSGNGFTVVVFASSFTIVRNAPFCVRLAVAEVTGSAYQVLLDGQEQIKQAV
jgi:hypothetical protein